MNKDLEGVCDYYVGMLIDAITDGHGVCGRELHGIWKNIKRPARGRKRSSKPQRSDQPRSILHTLKDDDLRRHCVRNGILPPTNRDDMIRVLTAKLRHP